MRGGRARLPSPYSHSRNWPGRVGSGATAKYPRSLAGIAAGIGSGLNLLAGVGHSGSSPSPGSSALARQSQQRAGQVVDAAQPAASLARFVGLISAPRPRVTAPGAAGPARILARRARARSSRVRGHGAALPGSSWNASVK